MKVLAKTKGDITLLCDRQSFLDSSRYRVVDYDTKITNWKTRGLIDIKSFLKDEATDEAFKNAVSEESFLNQYREGTTVKNVEEKKEQLVVKKIEENKEPVVVKKIEEKKEPVVVDSLEEETKANRKAQWKKNSKR